MTKATLRSPSYVHQGACDATVDWEQPTIRPRRHRVPDGQCPYCGRGRQHPHGTTTRTRRGEVVRTWCWPCLAHAPDAEPGGMVLADPASMLRADVVVTVRETLPAAAADWRVRAATLLAEGLGPSAVAALVGVRPIDVTHLKQRLVGRR